MMRFNPNTGNYEWNRGDNEKLSPNFWTYEFNCQCGKCQEQKISQELILNLEYIRSDNDDKPMRITSGFRCHERQKALSEDGHTETVKNSTHELGHACDFAPRVDESILSRYFRAIGLGKSFQHCDLRKEKERRWFYSY